MKDDNDGKIGLKMKRSVLTSQRHRGNPFFRKPSEIDTVMETSKGIIPLLFGQRLPTGNNCSHLKLQAMEANNFVFWVGPAEEKILIVSWLHQQE